MGFKSKSEMKRIAAIKGRVETYWICADCAKEKGMKLPKDYCGTVTSGLCGHCDRVDEAMLIPMRDYDPRAMWD